MWCSFSAPDHSHILQRQAMAITLELLPQVTLSRTACPVWCPDPSCLEGKADFHSPKDSHPDQASHKTRQGLHSLCQVLPCPAACLPLPTTLVHTPGAFCQEMFQCLGFCLPSINIGSPPYFCAAPPFLVFSNPCSTFICERCVGALTKVRMAKS